MPSRRKRRDIHTPAAGGLQFGNLQRVFAAGNDQTVRRTGQHFACRALLRHQFRPPDFHRLALILNPRGRHGVEGADFAFDNRRAFAPIDTRLFFA